MSATNQQNQQLLSELNDILLLEETKVHSKRAIFKKIHDKVDAYDMIDESSINDVEELKLLKSAAQIRENALVLLRTNKVQEGEDALEQAGKMAADFGLSKEGKLIAQTFQAAATAFLALKNKDSNKAVELMEVAMSTHKILFLEFGHPIEKRRIHLGRNIVTVLRIANETTKAFHLALNLINYTIFTSDTTFPFETCKIQQPNLISIDLKYFVLNQILREIGSILIKNPSEKYKLAFEQFAQEFNHRNIPEYKIVTHWVETYLAFLNNDSVSVYQNAINFYQIHDGMLPSVAKQLKKDIDAFSRDFVTG